jgi:hypothetical protein
MAKKCESRKKNGERCGADAQFGPSDYTDLRELAQLSEEW